MVLEAVVLNVRHGQEEAFEAAMLHHFYDPFPVVEHYVDLGAD